MRLLRAFAAAALAPVVVLVAWYLYEQFEILGTADPSPWVRAIGFMALCLAVSTAHVIVLGTPAYLVLRRLKALRWWSALLCGFVSGAVPIGVVSWPLRYSGLKTSVTLDQVQTFIGGVPTTAGWLQYLALVSLFGVAGAFAAAAFWMVRRVGYGHEVE